MWYGPIISDYSNNHYRFMCTAVDLMLCYIFFSSSKDAQEQKKGAHRDCVCVEHRMLCYTPEHNYTFIFFLVWEFE